MADLSNIDSEKIRTVQNQLLSIFGDIHAQTGKLSEAIARLDKGWVSTVKGDFMTRWTRDQEAIKEMLSQCNEFDEQLERIAQDFEKTEEEIQSNVNSLAKR